MNLKKCIMLIITIVLIVGLCGCNNVNDKNNKDNKKTLVNKEKVEDLNIGSSKNIYINEDSIYYIDSNDSNKLYVTDRNIKDKKLINDNYFIEIDGVENDEIYGIIQQEKDDKNYIYNLCSINKNDGYQNVIAEDVVSAAYTKNKFYYYRLTDEVADMVGNQYSNFCSYDLKAKKEEIIEEKIITAPMPVCYKNKIYYYGSDWKRIEYNPDTKEKRELNISDTYFSRIYDNTIYSYKGSAIEKTTLGDNQKTTILPENQDIYNIWDMNETKEYIYFLAQDTKEVENSEFKLHLYRMNKDGKGLKKVYSSEYDQDIFYAIHKIYNLGDKIMLYELKDTYKPLNRNLIQLIDYNGKEIDSSFFNK